MFLYFLFIFLVYIILVFEEFNNALERGFYNTYDAFGIFLGVVISFLFLNSFLKLTIIKVLFSVCLIASNINLLISLFKDLKILKISK